MPALGLTDHGVMNGAVEHYKACHSARDQAHHGAGGLPGRRSPSRRPARRAQPPHPAGLHGRRLSQPGQAHLGRLPRGLRPGQAERRPGAARPARGGRDRPHGLPPVAPGPPPGRGAAGGRPCPPGRAARRLRARERLLRDPGQRAGGAGEGERGHRSGGEGAGPAAGGDGRRPLPAPRGLLEPRGASLRADQVHHRATEAALRDQRVLPQEPRRDGRVVLALAGGGGDDARGRRALRGRDRARPAALAPLPDPRRRGACRDAAPACHRGPASAATGIRRRRRPASGSSSSSR